MEESVVNVVWKPENKKRKNLQTRNMINYEMWPELVYLMFTVVLSDI